MRRARLICLVAVFPFCLYAQERLGNQAFRIPSGWTRSEMSGTTVLSPAAEKPNFVVIVLGESQLNGDFRQAFERQVASLNGKLHVVRSSSVQGGRTADGYDLLSTTAELRNPNGVPSLRYYTAANVDGRYESLVFMTVSAPLFQRYFPTVQEFLTTWTFGKAPAGTSSNDAPPAAREATVPPPAASSAPASNRLEGVYAGYKYVNTTVLGVVQRKAVNDYFSFFPDGSVYWGLPQTGLVNFNAARACQNAVEFCGNYVVNGDAVTIVLNRGTYRQVGTLTPGQLQIADRRYTLQGDISKSTARGLDGTFGRADAQPREDLSRRFIRFTRDGRFLDQGLVTTVVSTDFSSGRPQFERSGGSGTYTLGPYTIILQYSDGYRRQLGVTIQPADMDRPVLSQIFVNTYSLVRR
jgi:hypothetical protein